MIFRLIVFLGLNFGALYLGALLMGASPADNVWYQSLNKAPWTPPGWVFGAAWTLIMICYSIYMSLIAVQYEGQLQKKLFISYGIHLILNIAWNPLFFQFHLTGLSALVLFALVYVLILIHLSYSRKKTILNLLLAPYLLWLMIASSLNLYVLIMN
jgi:translocator protein